MSIVGTEDYVEFGNDFGYFRVYYRQTYEPGSTTSRISITKASFLRYRVPTGMQYYIYGQVFIGNSTVPVLSSNGSVGVYHNYDGNEKVISAWTGRNDLYVDVEQPGGVSMDVPIRISGVSQIGNFTFYQSSEEDNYNFNIPAGFLNARLRPTTSYYTLSISRDQSSSISVVRTDSSYGNIGVIENGATLFQGDMLQVSFRSTMTGYTCTCTLNGEKIQSGSLFVVSGNIVINAVSSLLGAGRIVINGSERMCQSFVYTGGVWKQLIPSEFQNGSWKTCV